MNDFRSYIVDEPGNQLFANDIMFSIEICVMTGLNLWYRECH